MATLSGLLAIEAGKVQLYSNYRPSLPAGDYEVTVKQSLATSDNSQKIPLESTKKFQVQAPALHLDPADVHSFYPPQGASEHADILPFISLNDPNLPWEREIATDNNDGVPIPWLALLVFDRDELMLSADALDSSKDVLFTSKDGFTGHISQSRSQGVSLKVGDLRSLKASKKVQVPTLGAENPTPTSEQLDIALEAIFVQRSLFSKLFGDFDATASDWKASQNGEPVLDRYKWLSHVRHVNTHGMAKSGVADEEGLFSIVMSHRGGPSDIKEPKTMCVHLVSLDFHQGDINMNAPADLIALVSLYSWTYNCIPPEYLSFRQATQNLTSNIRPLRYPETSLAGLKDNANETQTWLRRRLIEGYTLIRYVTQTGESSMGVYRGPLVPGKVEVAPFNQSNNGTDLQILDTKLGMPDLTYGSAWELGKSLALSDSSFATALLRVRGELHGASLSASKIAIDTSYMSRSDVLKNVVAAATSISDKLISVGQQLLNKGSIYDRWSYEQRPDHAGASLRELVSWDNPSIQFEFKKQLDIAADVLIKGGSNASWSTIEKWLMDALTLEKIPASYLIPDGNVLPHEAISTFYIDDTWMDSLIDGALSIGNHYDKEDHARRVLKERFTQYLATNNPPIPRWGLLIRSDLVAANSDIHVGVPKSNASPTTTARVVSTRLVANDTLLCLFDRYPEDPSFDQGITISQPPHQQRFSVGELSANSLKFEFRSVYTSSNAAARKYEGFAGTWTNTRIAGGNLAQGKLDDEANLGRPAIYSWNSRTILLPDLIKVSVDVLKLKMKGEDFNSQTAASSAFLALQLNEPLFKVNISTKAAHDATGGTLYTPLRRLNYTEPPARKGPDPLNPAKSVQPPHKMLPSDNNKPKKPATTNLGPAKDNGPGNGPYFCTQKVWPLRNFGQAIPANWGSPMDLVFCIKGESRTPVSPTASNVKEVQISIPLGNTSSSLFSLTLNPADWPVTPNSRIPNIRMVSTSKRWAGSVSLSSSSDKLLIGLLPCGDRKGIAFESSDDLSFILGPVYGITDAGTVVADFKVISNGTTQTSQFEILKEKI